MRWHRQFAFLALFGLAALAVAQDEPTPSESGDASPKPVPFKERFKWAGRYLGKVTRINAGQMTMTVQVSYQERKADQGAFQRLAQLQQQAASQQAQLARAAAYANPRNPGSIRNLQNLQRSLANLASQIAQTQQRLYRLETKQKNVDVEADEKVAVRVPKPPYAFDDKGHLVKYTPEQLKELKGDPDLWGYPADFDRLAVGQRVQIFLGKTKPRPSATAADDDGEYPLVRLIYILDEDQ